MEGFYGIRRHHWHKNYGTAEKNGITQAELARRVHLTRSSINSWEQELSYPSIDSLCSLADVFHVSVDYLVGFSKRMSINIENYTEREQEMILGMLKYFDETHEMLRESAFPPSKKQT